MRLNHFGQYKTASLLLMESNNSALEIKHCQYQLMTCLPSMQILHTIN